MNPIQIYEFAWSGDPDIPISLPVKMAGSGVDRYEVSCLDCARRLVSTNVMASLALIRAPALRRCVAVSPRDRSKVMTLPLTMAVAFIRREDTKTRREEQTYLWVSMRRPASFEHPPFPAIPEQAQEERAAHQRRHDLHGNSTGDSAVRASVSQSARKSPPARAETGIRLQTPMPNQQL
ncbi:MAG: hypothetical protein HY343_12660 [Lentisphaerae bacterium]|nr:hypothetical protein [Lentisphaerota bacterium]